MKNKLRLELIEHVVYCIGVDIYTKIRTTEVFTEHAWFRHCAFTGLASIGRNIVNSWNTGWLEIRFHNRPAFIETAQITSPVCGNPLHIIFNLCRKSVRYKGSIAFTVTCSIISDIKFSPSWNCSSGDVLAWLIVRLAAKDTSCSFEFIEHRAHLVPFFIKTVIYTS